MARSLPHRLLPAFVILSLPSCGLFQKSSLIYWNGTPAYDKKAAALPITPAEAKKRFDRVGAGPEVTAIVDNCYYADPGLHKLQSISPEGLFLDGYSGKMDYRWGYQGQEADTNFLDLLVSKQVRVLPERVPELHYSGREPVRTPADYLRARKKDHSPSGN